MTNQTPNFYALLIGINFYFPHRLPEGNYYKNLRGCVPDINHVETYLKDTFNLTSDQIIKLTATASDNPNQPQEAPELLPTYENIVAKFKELTAKAQPQDQVYIHYSGHGGRAKTIFESLKGFGALDEALVPTDIGQPNSRYLRDIEFAKLLEAMVEKELVVTLVLDSCHSGGATREMSGDDRIRGEGFIDTTPRPTDSLVASLQELAQNWQTSTENSRNITVVNGLLPEPKGYTLIAACRDHEFAYEKVFEGTERNGALTYFLLKALREEGTEISVEELFNKISSQVNNEFVRQTPMLMGETDRTFFGGQSVSFTSGASPMRSVPVTRTVRTVPVMQVDIPKNQVKLQIGEASSIKEGAEFEIFKFRTRDFKDEENRIARVKVVEVGASDCWAEVTKIDSIRAINPKLYQGMIDRGMFEIGSPAVYVSPGLKQIRKVRLLLPDTSPQFPGVNIASISMEIEWVKTGVEGHGWIEFCSEDEKDENVDYFVSLNSEGEYWILDDNKEPIKNVLFPIKIDEPEATKRLIDRLIHVARYETILELDNEDAFATTLNGKLKVELGKSQKREFIPFNTEVHVPVLEESEKFFVRIHNGSKRILNISALIFQPDLSIVKFYPKGIGDESVDPGQDKGTSIKLELPENYQEGVFIIKVFATVDATNFNFLELPALDQSRKGVEHPEPKNALEQLLAAVVDEENPKRKITVVIDASEEWTTEKVEVVVKKSGV
ncbi:MULTISPECIES: caspase family protein [unclassified Microcoleus]|uniref:caspase family protein n=1 Tax=unclassified Microcoleus TaxID=2642155 RepID=UPI002FD3D498